MRGKDLYSVPFRDELRITPAYAGKSHIRSSLNAVSGDHPRVCGEKISFFFTGCSPRGSPPRMRGKAVGVAVAPVVTGITPAYAGKRASQLCAGLAPRDHPRVCGEKAYSLVMSGSLWGSPPRMRGKAGGGRERHPAEGITPAYAGKSQPTLVTCFLHRDHPRVCGEKNQWQSKPAG